MKKLQIFSIIILQCICISLLSAQEIQVQMDENGKVTYIDSALNNKIAIFDTYPGFIEARLFKISDSTFSMEIYYKVDENFSRQRISMNQSEVKDFRAKVSNKVIEQTSNTINQDGRSEYVWGMTLAGLGLYGPASVNITNASGSTAVGLYMLTSAASFLIPYYLTSDAAISDGAARLGVWGAYSGAGHGALLYQFLGIDNRVTVYDPFDEYSYTETDYSALYGLMALTSITESYIGLRIAQEYNFSAGKSDLMVNTSTAATGALPGLLYVLGVDNEKALYGTAILGSFVGYGLGNYISNTQNYTRGDAMCFSNAWIISALVPTSILIATKSADPKVYIGSAILSTGLGMWLGNTLVKGKDFSTSQGVYMSLASFGGAFVAGGVTFLAMGDGNSDNDYRIAPPLITLGAIAGFSIAYSAFSKDPQIQEKDVSDNLKIDFNPVALSSAFTNQTNMGNMYYYNPFLSLTYKF
jgi:hypothetical protein